MKARAKHLDECFLQPTLLSGIQCIASDFLLKSQTNFYIPPNAIEGYSYLDHVEAHSPHIGHHSHLFVQAEPSSLHLHPHHPIQWPSNRVPLSVEGSRNNSTHGSLAFPPSPNSMHHVPLNYASNMTIPYIHPDLKMPVPPLYLPWYFGALCFSFSLGGIFMLYWTPRWILNGQAVWFPHRTFAWALILLQGPCSFLADYVHMTNNSPWHLIDRFLACILMSLELVKLVTIRPYTRPAIYFMYLVGVSMAIFCFMKSQESQRDLSADGFIFWHCGWHCYPLWNICVVWLERWLSSALGEYHSFDSKAIENKEERKGKTKYERGEKGGLLLSTVVMEYFYGSGDDQQTSKYSMKSPITGYKGQIFQA